MRRTRRLFLVALIALLGGVLYSYVKQRAAAAALSKPLPPPLPGNTRALSADWVYYKGTRECPETEIRAKEAEGIEQPAAKLQLRGVEMRVFHSCGKSHDLVKAESADFDEQEGTLYAEGDVEITLAVPEDAAQAGRLVRIKAAGVRLDAKEGIASTTKRASFSFDLGDGEATGAEYNPHTRELTLHSDVTLHWRGREGAIPMTIQAGHLVHKEAESKVYLSPWAKLVRETLTMEAGDTVATLDGGNIRLVEGVKARGSDRQKARPLEFGANELRMELAGDSQVEKITGTGDARLTAASVSSITDIRTPRIEMSFALARKESLLRTAVAQGKTVLESRPLPQPGRVTPHTRILRSDGVVTHMRPDGEEVEMVETTTPGEVDLLPNHASQPRRWMSASRMWMKYGQKNQLESFRAVQVATRTVKPPRQGRPPGPPAETWSHDLTAQFDPESGDMTRMEQWNEFRYKEGEREAVASRAVLATATDLITLTEPTRAWDPTGSVSAKSIVMNQKTGDYTAEGDVNSTRLPDKKKQQAKKSSMLSEDDPMQAKANRMTSTDENRHLVYEGNAVLWQAGNRLQADRVVINRARQELQAESNVISQFLDKKLNPKTRRQPVTVVRAKRMRYSDNERMAHYTGGVRLDRDLMNVKSRELRAWLDEDSALHHAFADGEADIFQADAGRTRHGSGEHAEYYTADEKVVLNGGNPQMIDSVKGTTRGKQLTYWSGNDSLLVEGAVTQPVFSVIRRK
ncbi:MAG: hypothetical protein FJW39_23180 [Acidobacteria bacterium]|nr:hypothetical protein [Acidobacteriota bacterium]